MRGAGHVWILPLDDGRRLVVRPQHPPEGLHSHLLIAAVALVLAFVLGAYPIARRLTRRLERLQSGVEQLGKGDLATRVPVEGRDEVAALARSFNRSAERIEELVKSHKLLLANCSHELRTPLARIRLGLERLARRPEGPIRDELTRSIAELDALIDEMLLASRLDALKTLERAEDVDLLALAAEEAAQLRSERRRAAGHHSWRSGLAAADDPQSPGERGAPRRRRDAHPRRRRRERPARLVVEDRGPAWPTPIANGSSSRSIAGAPRARRWRGPVSGSRSCGRSLVRTAATWPLRRSRAGGSRFTVTLPIGHE